MVGLLLLYEMTIIKTIAPHLENVLMQSTAQNSQEAAFKNVSEHHQQSSMPVSRAQGPLSPESCQQKWKGTVECLASRRDQRDAQLGVEGLSGEKEETEMRS